MFLNKFFRRVSTIHTYPSSPSIIERQEIIDEEPVLVEQNQLTHQINNNQNEINQATNIDVGQEQEQQPQSNESSQVNIKYLIKNKIHSCFFRSVVHV